MLKATGADQVTLIGAGVTLHNCIAAAKTLGEEGIPARVIDLYFIKPIDAATLAAAAGETGRLVLVEDHHPEGGLGEAVLEGLAERGVSGAAVAHLAVTDMPGSGTTTELLAAAGLAAPDLAAAARTLISGEA